MGKTPGNTQGTDDPIRGFDNGGVWALFFKLSEREKKL
jgi:hypothetical protein